MNALKLRISLVAMNPGGAHCTSIYLLKAFAQTEKQVRDQVEFRLHFFDSLIPAQSNALDFILRKVLSDESDVIGFSCYCWNIKEILELSQIIKMIAPQKTILLGGPEVTGNAEEYLTQHPYLDYIIKGEGEIAFRRFLMYLLGNLSGLSEVNNLVYRKNGAIVYNEELTLEDLSLIPPIFATGIVDVNNMGESIYSFETQRGCRYNCDYCFHHKGSHVIREYPLTQVKAELGALLNSGLQYIWIIDPCFNENVERSIEIIKFIQENNHKHIALGFELRSETLTEPFIIEMSKIHSIRFIAIGMQTITACSLEAIHRDMDQEKFERNLRWFKKYFHKNVRIHLDLIYGLPKDTLQGYKDSIDYAISLGGIVFTQPLKILPGTKLQKSAANFGMVVNPNPPYELLYHDTFSFQDMRQAKKINAALNLYQADSIFRGYFDQARHAKEKRISEVFEEVGNYLWQKGLDPIFQNYREFTFGFLINVFEECFQHLYDIKVEKPLPSKLRKRLRIDWGSIAQTQFYR